MDFIGIDLDSNSKFDLLKTYLLARLTYPKSNIDVDISANHGYHIKIWKKVNVIDNFFARAYLGDCPSRLQYSMFKYLVNPEEQYNDLLFDEKNGRKVKKINMNSLLKPHTKDVNFIKKNWGSYYSISKIMEISEKLKIKNNSKIYVFCANFNGEKNREKLKMFGSEVFEKYKTKYSIWLNYANVPYNYCFVIFLRNKKSINILKNEFDKRFKFNNYVKVIKWT